MPRNAVQWCFHFSLFCRMSSTAGSQQSVWISATISCPLSNQSSKRTTQGKRVIENVSELNKNSPYSPSRSYFEHLKCWKIRTFLVVIFSNLTHASYQSLKITSHTFSFLYTCQITQVKWNEQILSEIVTGLMWCFLDWCTCSHGIHTETWPTPSTETLRIPSYQSGTSRTWAVILHLTTDILSSHCVQDVRTSLSCLCTYCMACHCSWFLWMLWIQFVALDRIVSPNISHLMSMCTLTFLYKCIGILSFVEPQYPWFNKKDNVHIWRHRYVIHLTVLYNMTIFTKNCP